MRQLPLRFGYIPYPLWRRRMPEPLRPLVRALLRPFYPLNADGSPPQTPEALASFLSRWRLLPEGIHADEALRSIASDQTPIDAAPETSNLPEARGSVRLPAQWEPLESVLLAFPVCYPPLWRTHAQMIEAITPVADVTLLLPAASWAGAIRFYLRTRSRADLKRVRMVELPTDDIWVRDYGPFVGFTQDGERAVIDAIFDPLGSYPQQRDDRAAARWAAYAGLPARRFAFHTEGGNYWSDGVGTLIVSDEMLARHPQLSRAEIEARLREAFAFEKLIILPRLLREETGHVDLVCKLVSADTVLVNTPNGTFNDARLREAARILGSETNAQGQRYRVIPLPFPSLYANWGVFPVWRSYTNSLTVNGHVLVPVFGIPQDIEVLNIYRRALPDHQIIPIDCRTAANGGGAVHCLTKEIPAPLC